MSPRNENEGATYVGYDNVCFPYTLSFSVIELFTCTIMIRLTLTEIAALIFCKNEYPYFDLAGETHRLWSSGRTPFPIGVGRNGKRVDSINLLTEFSALA